jgi:AAA domain/Bifunctional DNA primase/polymerase, N-terminal
MEPSVYDIYAPMLADLGYHPLPIAPGTKAPHRWTPSENAYRLFEGWQERPEPILTPQPGAGIGVRCGDGLVILDCDDDECALRVLEALPSEVVKEGARGCSIAFYADFPVPSENWTNADGELMLQVLSTGRQSVIPPTIHPDTKQPYRYHNGKTFHNTPKPELPLLPRDYRERIAALGYLSAEQTKRERQPEKEAPREENDSPFWELNALAMKDLAGWVPDLGLYDLKRRPGATPSYEAVASFRPGAGGKRLEERKRNLKISGRHGIVDFGDNERGYSPLDLVMVAKGLSLSAAYDWLDERVGRKDGPDVDFDALAGAWQPDSEEEPAEPGDDDTDEAILRSAGVWLHGETPPPEPLCSFERFLPLNGAGSIVAQTGCRKTFLAVDLCVANCAETGDTSFAGRKRFRRGGSVIIEFEHSDIPIRVETAKKKRQCTDEVLPLMAFTEAPTLLQNKRVNKKAIDWYRTVLKAAHNRFLRKFNLPLTVVHVDPLIDAGGYESENDNVEAWKAKNIFKKLSIEFDCLFVICDHAGKDIEKGARGASSKKGKDDFQITLPEKVDDPTATRLMTVKKLRNLPDGWGVEYWFEDVEVEVADGRVARNQAVCWGREYERGEAPPGGARKQQAKSKLSKSLASALRVLGEVCTAKSKGRSDTVTWVSLDAWFDELLQQHVINPRDDEPDQKTVFWNFMSRLREAGEIKISGDRVCIPI